MGGGRERKGRKKAASCCESVEYVANVKCGKVFDFGCFQEYKQG
ncbi:MAG TPA: hypothetical protein PK147_11645 [Saprospiraceae bacterium]|nr:hypothetical protein [Saprospiraceae bacterium]